MSCLECLMDELGFELDLEKHGGPEGPVAWGHYQLKACIVKDPGK